MRFFPFRSCLIRGANAPLFRALPRGLNGDFRGFWVFSTTSSIAQSSFGQQTPPAALPLVSSYNESRLRWRMTAAPNSIEKSNRRSLARWSPNRWSVHRVTAIGAGGVASRLSGPPAFVCFVSPALTPEFGKTPERAALPIPRNHPISEAELCNHRSGSARFGSAFAYGGISVGTSASYAFACPLSG